MVATKSNDSSISPVVSTDNNMKTASDENEKKTHKVSLSEIRKAIPAAAFKKDLVQSLYYMILDFALLGATYFAFTSLVNSEMWPTLPFYAQALATVIYWNIAGLFMWCQFVIGHDCGHGNFSNYEIINDILGHISHGFLLVPYWPWQLSHRRHHMHHNHVRKDYSHPWVTPDQMANPRRVFARVIDRSPLVKMFIPFFGWFIYILGIDDGSHFFPLAFQRMWRESPIAEYFKCLVSAAVTGIYAFAFYQYFGSLSAMAFYYFGPLVMFAWWLVTVTYLQHHAPSTLVYDDHDWKFVEAGFETVDREYGFGIDHITHHITDGHVAHHLFYTQIPHYNLRMATKAIRTYLAENNLEHLYHFEETHDFAYRIHKYLVCHGFRATRADPVNYPGATSKKTD